MKKYYCPQCGEQFDKPDIGTWDVPNGPGAVRIYEEKCPHCGWMGFKKQKEGKARICGCGHVHKPNERCGPW